MVLVLLAVLQDQVVLEDQPVLVDPLRLVDQLVLGYPRPLVYRLALGYRSAPEALAGRGFQGLHWVLGIPADPATLLSLGCLADLVDRLLPVALGIPGSLLVLQLLVVQ